MPSSKLRTDQNIISEFCFCSIGMHKKSIEAAHKLNEDDDDKLELKADQETDHPDGQSVQGKEEFRTESIAALRAKAQTYSAKIREGLEERERISLYQKSMFHHNNNNNSHLFPVNHDGSGHVDNSNEAVSLCSSGFEHPRHDDNSTCDSEPLDPAN